MHYHKKKKRDKDHKKKHKKHRDKDKDKKKSLNFGSSGGINLTVVKPTRESSSGGDVEVLPPELTADMRGFDPKLILYKELKDIIDLAVKAKEAFRELPDGENASSLTMMLGQLREYTLDIYELTQEDKDGIFDQMQHKVLQPILTRLIRALTSEFDSLKRQLTMSMGEEHTKEIENALRASLKNFGPTLKAEYSTALSNTKDILEVDVDVKPLLEALNTAIKTK